MANNLKNHIYVIDSYKLSDGRIIAFLKSGNGKLFEQSILEDEAGHRWTIKCYFWTTGSPESYEKIKLEEAQNIFQYLLEDININEKPTKSSKLIIV